MSAFLTDTLIWTGALLALVLLIRRPVASAFGPKSAYALWTLPMARLLMPPLVLPAWMAPQQAPDPVEAAMMIVEAPLAAVEPVALTAAPVEAAPLIDWGALLMTVWLAGAAIFLIRRYSLYFAMRRELLASARPVGEAGRVRLVETPAADGPVAFGVIDKVVALPPGFMASRDRAARDLALAHELAHHRGHDLVCNMLVQPLFALHWFTPLATLGWRALRRDQEAACDARVIASQPRESRATYAAVIARYATQPHNHARLALAAPMACPVLGDRSILQRLKSLAMTDISARRRWTGRLLIGAAALALPLTGSISYAQSEPAAPPPAPPAPPAAQAAPQPPAAPEAPRVIVDKDGRKHVVRVEHSDSECEDGKHEHKRVVRRVTVNRHGMSAEDRAEFERDMAELHKELGEHGELRRELEHELGPNSEFQREMREQFGENGEFRREMKLAVAEARAEAHAAAKAAPMVTMRCRQGQKEVAETVVSKDGKQHIFVCNAIATAEARRAIAVARAEIARNRDMPAGARAEALRSLEEAERESRAD